MDMSGLVRRSMALSDLLWSFMAILWPFMALLWPFMALLYGIVWPFYWYFMAKERYDWNCIVFSRGH